VKATDGGVPIALSSIVPVTITIKNINDRIPEFVNLKVLSLRLPAYKGMIVDRLHAVDYDIIPDELAFSLTDQSNIFDIHKTSGNAEFLFDKLNYVMTREFDKL
jgi:hypothetical protein